MGDFFPKELNYEICQTVIQQCIYCKTNIFNVAFKNKTAQYMLLENNNAVLVKNENKSGKYPLIFLKKSDIINSK